MDQSIKAKWIAALRSGEYAQGKGALNKINPVFNEDGNYTGERREFCCLGVLCEIAVKHSVIPEAELVSAATYKYGDATGSSVAFLPLPVREWTGIFRTDPLAGDRTLSSLNDKGKTFAEIADLIEEYL